MSLSDFKALANLPFAEVYMAVEMEGRDPATEQQVPFYLTNAGRLFTEPGDTPPNEPFRSVIVKGWRTERRLTREATFTGPSEINYGELVVAFHVADGSPSPFVDWLDLDFNNQPVTIKVGGRIKADGTPYGYADFQPHFVGVIDDVVPGDGILTIRLAGRTILCQQPVVEDFYRAFGGALLVEAKTSGDVATAADHASFDTSGAITLEWFGIVRAVNSSQSSLFQKGEGTDVAYRLGVSASGQLRVQVGAGTNVRDISEYSPPVDTYQHIAASIDADGTVTVHVGTRGENLATVGTAVLPSASGSSPVSGAFYVGQYTTTSTQKADVEAWEIRVWSGVRTLEQLRETADAPLVAPKDNPAIVSCWKFGDGDGDEARSEVSPSQDLVLTGCAFTSSLEGDDPEQFGGDLLGQTKPRTYGPAFNVPLTSVDQQRHDAQWSDQASTDILRLKVNGAPMVPDETLTSASLGDFSFDSTTNEVVIDAGAGLSFHRFIQGQADPYVPGQTIEISNSTSWDGLYRIATKKTNDAISADGLRMQIVSEFDKGLSGLSSGDMPAGTVIESAESEVQYSYDLATSTVRTAQTPPGPLTADVVGLLGAASTVSDIFAAVVGEAITNDLTFDPVVSVHVATGERLKTCELLDVLARSALGYWIEQRGGGYRLGNFTEPSGTPAAHLVGSRIHAVAAAEVFDIVGSIVSISPLRAVVPSWQNRAAYDRSWFVHDGVAGSVPEAMRQRLTGPFRFSVRTYPAVRERWPTSQPLGDLETLIVYREDAEELLTLAKPLFSERVRWFRVTVAGLGMLAIDLGDVVFLEHPDTTYGLTGGVLATVVSMVEDTSSDLIELEVYTCS